MASCVTRGWKHLKVCLWGGTEDKPEPHEKERSPAVTLDISEIRSQRKEGLLDAQNVSPCIQSKDREYAYMRTHTCTRTHTPW